MRTPFLEVKNVTKSFGGLKATANVSFNVNRDEIVGLIGPNGAGKTTLLRQITGILKPDSGTIHFKGKNPDQVGIKCSSYYWVPYCTKCCLGMWMDWTHLLFSNDKTCIKKT